MSRPMILNAGLGIGLLGGIISMILVGYAWDGSLDSITNVGFSLLVMAMFFAVAGGFAKGTNMSGKSIAIIAAVCVAAVLIATVYSTQFLWVRIILMAHGVAEVIIASTPGVINYADSNRPA